MKAIEKLPVNSLKNKGIASNETVKSVFDNVEALQKYMEKVGKLHSIEVDKAGTPWLKRYDEQGNRIDKIEYPLCYWELLKQGYENGVLWQFTEKKSILPFATLGYITSYYDPGLFCPYTVSMATLLSVYKYADENLKNKYIPKMTKKKGIPFQGATWMTEIKGGSDLGQNTDTLAFNSSDNIWYLKGEKYFSSNAHAELAVVAARPHKLKRSVRNLALFLVPRYTESGELNVYIERLKNKIGTRSVPTGEIRFEKSEAFLLGSVEQGIYLIMEVLNLSRVANSIGSVALMQNAINTAYEFASQRKAFGKFVIEFPLMAEQFKQKTDIWEKAFALAWASAFMYEKVWDLKPPYNDEYHAFRLLTHMSKYYTAEHAIRTARWAMEVWAGIGTLQEFPVERLLREALVLAIWEGTQHRHALDALEVITRKKAHIHLAKILPEKDREQFVNLVEKMVNDKQFIERNTVEFLYQISDFFADKLRNDNLYLLT